MVRRVICGKINDVVFILRYEEFTYKRSTMKELLEGSAHDLKVKNILKKENKTNE